MKKKGTKKKITNGDMNWILKLNERKSYSSTVLPNSKICLFILNILKGNLKLLCSCIMLYNELYTIHICLFKY